MEFYGTWFAFMALDIFICNSHTIKQIQCGNSPSFSFYC